MKAGPREPGCGSVHIIRYRIYHAVDLAPMSLPHGLAGLLHQGSLRKIPLFRNVNLVQKRDKPMTQGRGRLSQHPDSHLIPSRPAAS